MLMHQWHIDDDSRMVTTNLVPFVGIADRPPMMGNELASRVPQSFT